MEEKINFLFDVDGTLTPSRLPIDPNFESFLNENKVQYFHSKVGLNDIFAEGASTDYLMKKYQMNFESIYKTSIDLIK